MDKKLICLQVFDVVTFHIIIGVLKPLFEKSFMKRFLLYIHLAFTVLCLGITSVSAQAALSDSATAPHIEVRLIADKDGLVPGEAVEIGVHFIPEDGWHTYWKNPGDSGEAPTINWSFDADFEVGDLIWPIPRKIPVAHLVNYGYELPTVLHTGFIVPKELKVGRNITITADLSWLVCKEDCIPGWATLAITLPVVEQARNTDNVALFFKNVPFYGQSTVSFEIQEGSILFDIPFEELFRNRDHADPGRSWYLFPIRGDITNYAAEQNTVITDSSLLHTIETSEYLPAKVEKIEILLSDGDIGAYYTAKLNVVDAPTEPEYSLLVLIAMSFLGGLILNVMPCVLPILSMKALTIKNEAAPLNVKLGYLIGVLTTFIAFALIIIAFKQAGANLGWGFHMQSAAMIAFLAFLFIYIALALLDAAPGGNRLIGIGANQAGGKGLSSQFLTGVLAVVVASPCTAPFMATAMGVALVSSTSTTLLLFGSLGLGFALPLTLVNFSPFAARIIPKPGNWMITFREFLVFPMLATTVWLLWVFDSQSHGQFLIWLMVGLLVFAFFLWLASKCQGWTRVIFISPSLLLMAWTINELANYSSLDHLQAEQKESEPNVIPYSSNKLASTKGSHQIVLVNMTADWCITCKVNEQVAFEQPEVQQLFASGNIYYVEGDWTNKNQEILDYLQSYGRSGVPLYVLYVGDKRVEVLPQLLTVESLVNAITQAQEEIANES